MAQPQHQGAIARIAPVLRALRHADGGLARFHGGGRGVEGRLDAALSASRVRTPPQPGLAMGFARLARGRATVILDADRPPQGPEAAATGHASTLAFEFTVGRRPLVVNCGSGLSFGRDWEKAARATPAHSALTPDGEGSAVLRQLRGGRVMLAEGPQRVECAPAPERGPAALSAWHDGFAARDGLIHHRRLDLGEDGLSLHGEDILVPLDASGGGLRALQGLGFTIRFHLHPDVSIQPGEDGLSAALLLKSGEIWQFRHASPARMSLDPSVYLEKTRPQPTPTRQIVLDASASGSATTIRWSLSRVTQGAAGTRDLYRDDMSIT
nr:heparinase II/III-family protein [Mangrovicoccus sp. HB161399]